MTNVIGHSDDSQAGAAPAGGTFAHPRRPTRQAAFLTF
jgi:hypothetical protein